MRKISVAKIRDAISNLCILANVRLRKDIENAIRRAMQKETNKKARRFLKILLENAKIAKDKNLAICQDTGIVVVDIEIGQNVKIKGDLIKAINQGVAFGYKKGCFRRSIVNDPILRNVSTGYTPPVVYMNVIKGNKIKVTLSPKGFGSENKSRIAMLKPTDGAEEIKKFVINTVKDAGPDACPPFILGIGIGGTFDKAALLSKKALYRSIDKRNPKPHLRKLENEILEAVNKLSIGPMGLGGRTTCLGVNILDAPTHIAGLPIAVNVSCHATRSASVVI